jgi:hypothetical protein
VLPDFLPETKHIRDSDSWKGAPPAPGLGMWLSPRLHWDTLLTKCKWIGVSRSQ